MSSVHDHRLLVLSNAAPGRDAEFNAWYDAHVPHVLEVPGIDAAHRLRFSADQFPADVMPASPHTYISIYEVSSDPASIIEALLAPQFAEGLPDAFDTASERAWWYTAVGERVGPAVEDPDNKLLVFSNPATEALDGELNAWYDHHLHDVLAIDAGVVNAQRFRFSDQQFPESVMPPSEHRYLAIYDTNVPPAKTAGTLAAAMVGYEHPHALDGVTLRDWMFSPLGARQRASVAQL
jgi:hypothetical protein